MNINDYTYEEKQKALDEAWEIMNPTKSTDEQARIHELEIMVKRLLERYNEKIYEQKELDAESETLRNAYKSAVLAVEVYSGMDFVEAMEELSAYVEVESND